MPETSIYANLVKNFDDIKSNIIRLEDLKKRPDFDWNQWKSVMRRSKNYLGYRINDKVSFVNSKIIGYMLENDAFARRGNNGDGDVTTNAIDGILGECCFDDSIRTEFEEFWNQAEFGEIIESKKTRFWFLNLDAESQIRTWWAEHKGDQENTNRLESQIFFFQKQREALELWLNRNPISDDSIKKLSEISDPSKYSDSAVDEICLQNGLSESEKKFLLDTVLVLQDKPVISLDNYGRKVPLIFSLARFKLNGSFGDASRRQFEFYLKPAELLPASKSKMEAANKILRCGSLDQNLIDYFKLLNLDGIQCANAENQNHIYWRILWYALKLGEKKQDTVPNNRSYWLTGTIFNDTEQIGNFAENHYWEGGLVAKPHIMEAIKSVRKGDVLIAKSTGKKGPGHSVSYIRIKAVGLVTSNMKLTDTEDWYSCGVEWIKLPKIREYEGAPYGKYLGTMHLCKEDGLKILANEILGLGNEKMGVSDYSKYVKLLEANHNLILHGAPGTGKTYLAKAIANEMGADCTMVQFHQSYDYTDFVEGLRPAKGENGKADGFERKDGVFKAFCEKAEKNIIESSKNKDVRTKEIRWEKILEDYLDAVESDVNLQADFKTFSTNNPFTIESSDENGIYIHTGNDKTSKLKLSKKTLVELLVSDRSFTRVVEVKGFFNRTYHLQTDSYAFVLLEKIKAWVSASSEKYGDEPGDVVLIPKKKFVFIIDEINRGEMSKIFGELFFSIDPGYRGKGGKVRTQYANMQDEPNAFDEALEIKDSQMYGHFYVPENVYIIGTMNDIDRSVESMDFAMRRRFAFKEIKADERIGMLDDLKCDKKNDAIKRMQSLNTEIETIDGLSSAYHIGPAYFLKLDNYGGDFDLLWEYHIEGVLTEYLRGMEDGEGLLEELHKAYNLEKN